MAFRHPVIEQYCGSAKTLLQVLKEAPEPRGPVVIATRHLHEALAGSGSVEEALREAEALVEVGGDPSLYLLFLHAWSTVSLRTDRRAQAKALADRAEALLSEDVPLELHVLLLVYRGVMASAGGNHEALHDRYAIEAAKVLPRESPRYKPFLARRARWLARVGRLSDVQADMKYLEANLGPGGNPTPRELAFVRFLDHVATGRIEEAERLQDEIAPPSAVVGYALAEARPTLELMSGRWDPHAPPSASEARVWAENWPPPWAMSARLLQEKRPQEALDCARRMKGSELTWSGFVSFCLIRAELACGNGDAARRLLEMKRRGGGGHYLDHLFLARVERLAGNHEAVSRHFSATLRSVEHYRARGRLDFELSLACELSPADLVELGRSVAAPTMEPTPALPPRAVAPALEVRGTARLMGTSPALESVRETIRSFAPLDVPVLLLGETGTGKELAARALHDEGPRAAEPFIAVNCAAIAENLLESELFGHEKGAFTGAVKARKGIFESSGRGTVLLDEIGDISARLQVMLLRVLEVGEIRPVGASRTRKVSCRIIAATNADLEARAEQGSFRRDLLYRLRRLEIHIPPLRERQEDILPLVEHFLSQDRHDDRRAGLSEQLRKKLLAYPWPGNVRELRNEVEMMRLLNSDKLSYDAADLSLGPATAAKQTRARAPEREPAPPPSGVAPDRVKEILRGGKSSLRRRERLRELFREHRQLTRREVVEIMEVAPATATKDLKVLCAEGLIEKVMPSASPRSHYFSLSAQ